MSDDPSARPLRRALTAALGLQVLLALLLFAGDLGRDFSLPTRGPAAPDLDQPTTPGDQTRRYDPATRPAGPGVAPSGPMPERLVLTESDGAWSLSGQIAPGMASGSSARSRPAATVRRRSSAWTAPAGR